MAVVASGSIASSAGPGSSEQPYQGGRLIDPFENQPPPHQQQPTRRKPAFVRTEPHRLKTFALDASASGVIKTVNNIVNLTVASHDANDLKAEYRAGFIQGKLQGQTIISARDNAWDNAYLTNPDHTFPQNIGPTQDELDEATAYLLGNYVAFLDYLEDSRTDQQTAHRLKRLLFRMLGIYHGVRRDQPDDLDFSGSWLPDSSYLDSSELMLGYETEAFTFLDLYFLNAFNDLMDVITSSLERAPGGVRPGDHPDKCSAFLKRTRGEVLLAHNSWMSFLSQTMAQTLSVNGDLLTINAATPGLIGSLTDFGYYNKGIMFNETTHRFSYTEPKPLGIWIFWRAALAEQFSSSITEFFDAISLDNTGTYLNGYMLVDAKTRETGLVEMSYRCFIYYRSTGGPYTVTSKSLDGHPCSTDYDSEMVTAEYLMGINFPASIQVREDLHSTDNRPARREQFITLLPAVRNLANARRVIAYTDKYNPLSIFGRWDLGYGETDYPKQIPDGSVDAKVGSTAMVHAFMKLKGLLDTRSPSTGFWMMYGTPRVNGKPFIWSRSLWNWQTLRDVPDKRDGPFTLRHLYLR